MAGAISWFGFVMNLDANLQDGRCALKRILTSGLIQRRATLLFEFGLPFPPWMAYIVGSEIINSKEQAL